MKKRIISILLITLLIMSISSCGKNSGSGGKSPEEPNEEFAAFVDEQFKTALENDYTNLHFYYLDPEAAGFDMENVEISFGSAPTDESYQEDRDYYNSLSEALKGFDRNTLTESQKDEYDSLEWEIATSMELSDEKFDYYDQYFAPPNSLDANLVSYFSIWEVRNEREVQELILLLDTLPDYVESCIEYAKKQQEKELLQTDFDQVIEGCDDVIEIGMSSSVLTSLQSQVDEIESIEDSKKEEYKTLIAEAFQRSYLPCFTMIKDAMNEMKNGYNNTGGYTNFPNGKEYFQALLNYKMGTIDVTCDEAKKYLEDKNSDMMSDLISLMSSDPEAIDVIFDEDTNSGYSDYVSILEDVKVKMLEDHPEVKDLKYNIENADPEEKLDEKNVAAYFIVPPLDGDHKQQMRVDPKNEETESLDTYSTVTHEGFPGHMYQFAYLSENIDSDYLKTLEVDANVEGYAVYSQYGAMHYLDTISDVAAELYAINNRLGYNEYAIVDIGINYEGWDLEETHNYFTEAGLSIDEDTAKEIYDFLRFSPVTYEPYGYGYELIQDLRDNAEEELGDKFDPIEFNRALLNAGPTPYSVVKRHIDDYIASAK